MPAKSPNSQTIVLGNFVLKELQDNKFQFTIKELMDVIGVTDYFGVKKIIYNSYRSLFTVDNEKGIVELRFDMFSESKSPQEDYLTELTEQVSIYEKAASKHNDGESLRRRR